MSGYKGHGGTRDLNQRPQIRVVETITYPPRTVWISDEYDVDHQEPFVITKTINITKM